MSQEQDQIFFRNFAIVVVILLGMMVGFMVIANVVSPDKKSSAASSADAATLAPVGIVKTEASNEETAVDSSEAEAMPSVIVTDGIDGKTVYEGLCISCHSSGIPGVPQMGDAAGWQPRIATGIEQLYARAINGYTGSSGMMMPAKGGNPALSDEEVQAAVDYLVTNSQ